MTAFTINLPLRSECPASIERLHKEVARLRHNASGVEAFLCDNITKLPQWRINELKAQLFDLTQEVAAKEREIRYSLPVPEQMEIH